MDDTSSPSAPNKMDDTSSPSAPKKMDDASAARVSNPTAPKKRRKICESQLKVSVCVLEDAAHDLPPGVIEKWEAKTLLAFETFRNGLVKKLKSQELAAHYAVHLPVDINSWHQVRIDANPS